MKTEAKFKKDQECHCLMYDCMVTITKVRHDTEGKPLYDGIIDWGEGPRQQVFRECELSDYQM